MTVRNGSIFFLIATIISLLPDFIPYIWIHALGSNKINYIGSLGKYQQPCTEKFENSECKIEYKIPYELLLKNGRGWKQSLGLGYFLTDYAIKCDDQIVYSPLTKLSPLLVIDSYKIYKVIDLSSLPCSQTSTIKILALNTPGIPTHGQISANAVIGERDYVAAIKRTIEFLSVGIYVLFGIILIFSSFEMNILLRPLIQIKEEKSLIFSYNALAWAAFSLFKSGLFDILFLTPTSIHLLFRIQTGLSLFCHTEVLLMSGSSIQISKRIRTIILLLTLLVYFPFSFTKIFNQYLVYSVLIFSLIRLTSESFLKKKNWLLFFFAFCTLFECLKALAFKPLPTGSLTLAFIVTTQLVSSFSSIRAASLLASVNLWLRKATTSLTEQPDIYKLLSSFSEQIPANQVSFFEIQVSGNHQLYTFRKDTIHNLNLPGYLDDVPIGFSHVLTTGNNLLHKNALESSFKNIFQREPNTELGQYYSMIPIRRGDKLIGVIAITKYSFNPELDIYLRERFEAFIPAFIEVLALAAERRMALLSDTRLTKLTTLLHEIPNTYDNLATFFEFLLNLLLQEFDWAGFFGTYNSSTTLLDIIAHTYPLHKGGNILTTVKWEMKKENERAPGPLALFQGVDVIVPDKKWIKNTISENTNRFLKESGTESLLVVPIKRQTTLGKEMFGILWISAEQLGTFDTSSKRFATFLANSLENTIYRILHGAIEKTIFRGQVRPDIYERIMKGEDPVESGVGLLVNVDLAKSTEIPKLIGPTRWEEFQKDYVTRITELGLSYGLRAEMIIWDAIFFTKSSILNEAELIEFTKKFLKITSTLIVQYGISSLYEDIKKAGRVCATYGDITCQVTRGMWSLNGQMIAFMTKFESSLKGSPFLLATSKDLYEQWNNKKILKKKNINNKAVFVLNANDLEHTFI